MFSTPIRYTRLDRIRGFAVFLMLIFHFSFDLKTFAPPQISRYFQSNDNFLLQTYFRHMPDFIGTIFFVVLGFSATLKLKSKTLNQEEIKRSLRKKTLLIAALALLATLISSLYAMTIYFGVLHCIAVCLFLTYFLMDFETKKMKPHTLPIFVLSSLCSILLYGRKFNFSALLWLGFEPSSGQTGGDWYPLLPWFGVSLLGSMIAQSKYAHLLIGKKTTHSATTNKNSTASLLDYLGKHSLKIYILHQPIFMGIMTILSGLSARLSDLF